MADEKIIQITESGQTLCALTNKGRLFTMERGISICTWQEIDLPPLNKAKPRSQAKSEGYSEDFEILWKAYPKGAKGSKQAAYRMFNANLGNHLADWQKPETRNNMLDGVNRYKKYINATGQYLMHMSTFLGRDKHYLNDFTIPEQAKKASKPEWAKLPFDKNEYEAHAIKYNLPRSKPGESMNVYASRLQIEINQRLEE